MPGRRILITGIASYLGTELARILEADPRVEYVAGLDTRPPGDQLERTQLIVADIRDPEISGLIPPTEVDTVVHNQIVRRPGPGMSARRAHDINVIGSLQLLAACERTPTLRSIVVRGSAGIYGSEPAAPQFFTEEMAHLYPLRTRFQRDVGEIENLFGTYARRHPDVVCTMLRYQHSIGPTVIEEAVGSKGHASEVVGVVAHTAVDSVIATQARELGRKHEQVGTMGERRQRPGEVQRKVELVGGVVALRASHDGVLHSLFGVQRSR